MSKAEAREQAEFLNLLREEFPDKEYRETREFWEALTRRGRRSSYYAEMGCNVEMTPRQEACDAANDRAILALCASFGVGVTLQGDPRGFTVKLILPSGRWNTWGGKEQGFGVPGS